MEHKIPCWGYKISDGDNSLVFITDTLPNSNAVTLAKNVDILIHEATFSHHMRVKAKKHFHTTEIQAMEIADKANTVRDELYQMIRENTTSGQTVLVIGVGNTIGVSQ